LNEKAGADIRIVIVGNKIDLDDHTVSRDEANDYAKGLGL
jgi:GTPase SAR1 family protein